MASQRREARKRDPGREPRKEHPLYCPGFIREDGQTRYHDVTCCHQLESERLSDWLDTYCLPIARRNARNKALREARRRARNEWLDELDN